MLLTFPTVSFTEGTEWDSESASCSILYMLACKIILTSLYQEHPLQFPCPKIRNHYRKPQAI
jgi:hypothetical protein